MKYLAALEKLKTNLNTYKKEFLIALKAIEKASQIVMEIYHDDFTINYKNDKTEVTNADIASSKIIHAYQTNMNSKVVLSDTDNNSSITYEIPNCIIKNFKFSSYIL